MSDPLPEIPPLAAVEQMAPQLRDFVFPKAVLCALWLGAGAVRISVKRRRCTKCGKNRAERFFVSERGRVCSTCRKKRTRASTRNTRLVNTYGITQEQYDWMIAQQGGRCAGCLGYRRVYDVDHDHKLEKAGVPMRHTVRGGLCRSDNKILAMARDDAARLRRLADYLERGPVWPASD